MYDVCVSDGSMEKLYGGGEGQVFKQCVQWLEADTDNLKVLGALAVGNFARSGAFLLLLYECSSHSCSTGKIVILPTLLEICTSPLPTPTPFCCYCCCFYDNHYVLFCLTEKK